MSLNFVNVPPGEPLLQFHQSYAVVVSELSAKETTPLPRGSSTQLSAELSALRRMTLSLGPGYLWQNRRSFMAKYMANPYGKYGNTDTNDFDLK